MMLGPPNQPTWHLPAGWDVWNVFANDADSYLDTKLVTGANTTEQITQYTTDFLAERAKFVLDHKPANQPIFMLLAPFGPHLGLEMQPARYEDVLRNIPNWRPPSFNEADVSDKASVIQALSPIADTSVVDGNRRFMFEALLAVDDLVEVIWRVTQAMGNTIIIFMSDQGFFYGEHRLTGKAKPYDEAHRIPLAITFPNVQPRIESGLVSMQDITQTILSWGGRPLGAAGISIAQAIEQRQALTRTSLVLEGMSLGLNIPACARSGSVFTRGATDEINSTISCLTRTIAKPATVGV
jgi:arylsulfatase A-like enzyme